MAAKSITYTINTFWRSMISRRFLSRAAQEAPSRPSFSHIKAKLQRFVENGEIQPLLPAQAAAHIQHKNRRVALNAAKNLLSAQKALLLIRLKFDAALLRRGLRSQPVDLEKLRPGDLEVSLEKLLAVFENLMEMKRISKKKIPPKLMLFLCGVGPEALLDPFKVTEAVLKLLEADRSTARAMELCHMARGNAVVALNACIQWCFEHGKVQMGMKALHDRKKWMIPTNEQTYVLYFDGLARHFGWGSVTKTMADDLFNQFQRVKRPTVSVFNACLLVLLKSFSNNQQHAMELFELAEDAKSFKPDCQTFTIFLNGRKHYIQEQVSQVKTASNISATERTKKLFAFQAELVETAENVYKKVMELAIPPVPPTKAEAEADPEVLKKYREDIQGILMDIDPVFASTFVLCYVNNFAGTSVTPNSGSHYQYMLQGLEYLRLWCPEVELMLHFAKENDETRALEPSADVKRRTDERIEEASVENKDLPETHVKPLVKEEVNPLVVFPPPLFSTNKTRAIFSDKKKRLVDFSRPRFADVKRLAQHQTYVSSQGKFGKKLPLLVHISLEKGLGINNFLLGHATDSLLKIGAVKEFYLAMWYALTKWGGIYVSRTDLRKAVSEGLSCGALPRSQYPDLTRVKNEKGKFDIKECLVGDEAPAKDEGEFTKLSKSEKQDLTAPHEPTVIDPMLVENFIYKIEENFPKRYVPIKFITELLAAIVSPASNIGKTLKPRDKTFDVVFSILKRDIYHYNEKNLHKGLVANRKKKLANNTPKKSLTMEQLNDLLDPLAVLMKCVMVAESRTYGLGKNRQALMLNSFVDSYNSLVQHITSTTWTDAPENHDNALEVHKKILGSGILFYTPREIFDPRRNIANATVVGNSVRFVYGKLKDREDLDEKLKRLMLALKSFVQLESKLVDVEHKLKALQWRVYNACK